MKKITLIVAFWVAAFSYGQTYNGFVANPSFEDGSAGPIAGGATLNDWKLGGGSRNAIGVSASIQTTNVHAGDSTNALEVTSVETGGEWNIRLINTTYPFAGDNSTAIEVTVRFWAKTTDAAPGSLNADGDMRLVVKDTGSGNLGDKTNSVLLTTGAWAYITKTFTFPAAADYNLSLYLEFGKLDGVTQIDGITTSVSGGAVIGDQAPVINLVGANPQQLTRGRAYVELGATATDDTDDDTALTATIAIDASAVDTATAGSYSVTYNVSDAAGNAATQVTRTVTVEDGQTYSGFVVNPSIEDGSPGAIAKYATLNDWKLGGDNSGDTGVSASIQTTNIHAGDGANALEVTSVDTGGEWNIKVWSTTKSFDGDNSTPITVTVSFWAKTDDVAPGSEVGTGDMRVIVKDTGSSNIGNKVNRVLLTTGAWDYITKTFTFAAAADYSLSLNLEFGKLDGVTQIDGITTSVTGGATLASGITWDGSTDNDWNTATNWTPERLPNAADAYTIIPAGLTNYPTISSGEITVAAIDIKSGAAFVANGTATVTGAATYSRNLTHTAGNTNGWYLVASPLVGATFDDTWVNANYLATGSGTNRGLATYTESANTWDYFLTGESGTFTPGTGYSVKRSATGDVSFTGTINTADTDVTLVRTDNGFNLVANPYTSYINSETLLDNNTDVSNNKNIYVWNNGTTSYDTKISTAAFQVAPGQAFFVRSNEGGGTLAFEKSNQSDNSGTDTFQRTAATIPEIELSVADESTHRYIKLYFNDAATKGFDNGYDGDLFGGVANSFEIYSHLLEDNQGEKYQIQSLPNSDLASMVIPVGLKAASGKELAFSVKKLNLPTDIKVYLEDRVTNTFTLLDETNSVYNITLSSAIDGIGRFYLHTSNSVLSTSDVNLNSVSIFKINNSNLRVAGLSQGKASISLYNILGKQMMMTTFDAINSNDISLPKLAAGVYIVQLTTEAGKLNKKIILK
jgi:hypothetical protein